MNSLRCVGWIWLGLAMSHAAVRASEPVALLRHLGAEGSVGELRAAEVDRVQVGSEFGVSLIPLQKSAHAWVTLRPPLGGWNFGRFEAVEGRVVNRGAEALNVLLWVVGKSGVEAVCAAASLAPGESRPLRVPLRGVYPDGTPKLDPRRVGEVQLMITRDVRLKAGNAGTKPSADLIPERVELSSLMGVGDLPEWNPPAGRLELPPVEDGLPCAGHRVRVRLAGDEASGVYSVLHLPRDWRADGRYPVIVEYPGNLFMTPECYSTGRPEHCTIGYGMSRGMGAICVGLPFVDRSKGGVKESGWGVEEQTVDYALQMVEEVCIKFGGDRRNLVLTGFSRGALACGYIGLRNERIASLWKGFHACQHYDGDGWRGATMEGALERARRFRGRSVFHTDNSESFFRGVMDVMGVPVRYVQSGLGAHATAMFLDDRPSTQALREWFRDLVEAP